MRNERLTFTDTRQEYGNESFVFGFTRSHLICSLLHNHPRINHHVPYSLLLARARSIKTLFSARHVS